MSLYGYERATTPFLENLVEQGVVFDWAIAPCSWTLPTHASLFTGRFRSETGTNWTIPLGPKYPTLAEVLTDQGYATGGFVANPLACRVEQKALTFLPNFGDFVLSTCLDKVCRKQEISVDKQRHKNGQDARKTAFLADQSIAPRGFEPLLRMP
jgi:arylsulfatase A-like enzyme